MSARQPFQPIRSGTYGDTINSAQSNGIEGSTQHSLSSSGDSLPFQGLLSSTPMPQDNALLTSNKASISARKPLNISGLRKGNNSQDPRRISASQSEAAAKGPKFRASFEGVQRPLLPAPVHPGHPRSNALRAQSHAAEGLKIATPRPSLPFFPGNSTASSRAELMEMTGKENAAAGSESSAHISTSVASAIMARTTNTPDLGTSGNQHPDALSSREPHSPHGRFLAPNVGSSEHNFEPQAGSPQQSLHQRANKRPEHPEDTYGDDDMFNYFSQDEREQPAKRYKSSDMEYSRDEHGYNPPRQPTPASYRAPQNERSGAEDMFRSLFGQELDLEANMELFQAAQKRWSECSMEEWAAGADEFKDRFNEILSFVVDNMFEKMKVHSSLTKKLSDHKVVLAARDQELTEAKKAFISEANCLKIGGKGGISM